MMSLRSLGSTSLMVTPIGLGLAALGRPGYINLGHAEDLKSERNGHRLFDCVQATWNVLEPSAGPMLQTAQEAGMGVIIKEALANGRLTQRNHESGFEAKQQILAQEAERLGTTMDALSLAAVLAQSWADVVLSGAATIGHLHSNLKALDVSWDKEAADTLAGLAETPNRYWNRRQQLDWN
jgi:aryl-alcohol dehydrogenase-like predicted oxidoreductase